MTQIKKRNIISIVLFVLLGAGLIVVFVVLAGQFNFFQGNGYSLYVEYDFLDNLTVGGKVKVLGGPSIGQVKEIFFKGGKIVVELVIEEAYKINRDAYFEIYATSLVGQKYVNVSNYNPNATDVLKKDEYLIGVNPMGYTKILEIAGEVLKALLPGSGDETLARIKNTFQSTSDLVAGLNTLVKDNEKSVRLSIDQLYLTLKEIGTAAGSLNVLIADNQAQLTEGIGSIGKTLAEFEKTITSLESMMKKIESVASALDGKKIDSIVTQLESASKEIAKAANAINKVVADKDGIVTWLNGVEVRFELTNILYNLSLFSKKIKEDPSLIMWKK